MTKQPFIHVLHALVASLQQQHGSASECIAQHLFTHAMAGTPHGHSMGRTLHTATAGLHQYQGSFCESYDEVVTTNGGVGTLH